MPVTKPRVSIAAAATGFNSGVLKIEYRLSWVMGGDNNSTGRGNFSNNLFAFGTVFSRERNDLNLHFLPFLDSCAEHFPQKERTAKNMK